MRAADLKEAEGIVTSLAWLKKAQTMSLDDRNSAGSVRLFGPQPTDNRYSRAQEDYPLSPGARAAALKALKLEWATREAQLRRRAAQIGLAL